MSAKTSCWICGDIATSAEHKTKKSDLRAMFSHPTQSAPLYIHNAQKRNWRVASLNAKELKFADKICAHCNNARSQPYDRAWEKLSDALRNRLPPLSPGSFVRTNRIFTYRTRYEMLNVHLYFAKLFGCHITSNNIPLDIAGFANAILSGRPHPNMFLKFKYIEAPDGQLIVGTSDLLYVPPAPGEMTPYAIWSYDVGNVSVNVMFGAVGEDREGLVDAWHPAQGTTRLKIGSQHVEKADGFPQRLTR